MAGLTKKEMVAAIWKKFKGIIGTKDISGMGDGTVTGAITELNSNLAILDTSSFKITSLGAGSTITQEIIISDPEQLIPVLVITPDAVRPMIISNYWLNSTGNGIKVAITNLGSNINASSGFTIMIKFLRFPNLS